MEFGRGFSAVIGDLSGSRLRPDRARLQTLLAGCLQQTNDLIPSVQPLGVTWGDEFQGLYRTVDDALEATLRLRLQLTALALADVRFGVGWGFLVTFDPGRVPLSQDGPVWWAAREALGRVTVEPQRAGGPRGLRTWFQTFEGLYRKASDTDRDRWARLEPIHPVVLGPPGYFETASETYVNAYLICRDQLIHALGDKESAALWELLQGRRQTEIAEDEGVTQSAISQRFIRNGSYALRAAHELLRGTRA